MSGSEKSSLSPPRDKTAWAQFFRDHYAELIYTAMRRTGDRQLSQDLVQEVVRRFLSRRLDRKVEGEVHALALLRVMIRHATIDWFRENRLTKKLGIEVPYTEEVTAVAVPGMEDEFARMDIDQLMADLSPADRALLALILSGLGTREAAEQLGISYWTAVRRRQAVYNRLKEKVKK